MNWRTDYHSLSCAVALWLLVAGCTLGSLSIRDASARVLNCPKDDIEITEDHVEATRRTWTATCDGKAYQCVTAAKGAVDTKCAPIGHPGAYRSIGQ